MNAPFTEYEKRFVLTEIIKASAVPLDLLVRIITDQQIEPKWDELPLPSGRNMKGCAAIFQELTAGSLPNPRKRRLASPERRALQPRPAENGDINPSVQPQVQIVRKRGRPSNAARAAEAAARGEPSPVPKSKPTGVAAQYLPDLGIKPVMGSGRGRGRPRKSESTLIEVKDVIPEALELVDDPVVEPKSYAEKETLIVGTDTNEDQFEPLNRLIEQELRAA